MRRVTYGVIGGSIAFALTAASAIGTGIVLQSVEDVRGITSDSITVAESLCDGTYDITWNESLDGSGMIVGAEAVRTLPTGATGDPTLPFCAGAPAVLEIYDGAVGSGNLVAVGCDQTDSTGLAEFEGLLNASNPINPITPIVAAGWGVRLSIGDSQSIYCGGSIAS